MTRNFYNPQGTTSSEEYSKIVNAARELSKYDHVLFEPEHLLMALLLDPTPNFNRFLILLQKQLALQLDLQAIKGWLASRTRSRDEALPLNGFSERMTAFHFEVDDVARRLSTVTMTTSHMIITMLERQDTYLHQYLLEAQINIATLLEDYEQKLYTETSHAYFSDEFLNAFKHIVLQFEICKNHDTIYQTDYAMMGIMKEVGNLLQHLSDPEPHKDYVTIGYPEQSDGADYILRIKEMTDSE